MAVEKVLNQYCSDSDPSRPALKKLLEDLLDWFMLSERQIYLLKNENDKGNAFMIENLVHLWVTWKSLSQELALAISDPTSYLNRIKGWMNPIQTFLCPCYQRLFRIFPLKYPQKPQPPLL